jgi:hypothetical protein
MPRRLLLLLAPRPLGLLAEPERLALHDGLAELLAFGGVGATLKGP